LIYLPFNWVQCRRFCERPPPRHQCCSSAWRLHPGCSPRGSSAHSIY